MMVGQGIDPVQAEQERRRQAVAVKLDKRVSNLEAKGSGTALKKCHLVGLGQGTEDEAIDAYGRDLIGPDDMIIWLVGMSRAAEDDPAKREQADENGK